MGAVHAQPRPDAPRYERHRPEATLLYQLVERHYPAFVGALAQRGRQLPAYVHEEFAAYLKCGRLEHGFIRVRCTACHAERLVAYSCKRRGLLRASCPPPFGPACGCPKSLPAILFARAARRGA